MHSHVLYSRYTRTLVSINAMSLTAVLASGFALRFAVPTLLPHISHSLAATPQISTPIDSFRSIREAVYFLQNGMDAYDGGLVHHPPLLVAIFRVLSELLGPWSEVVFNFLFAAVDVGVAIKLTNLNRWYNQHQSKKTKSQFTAFSDALVASLYLFNPLMVLTNWAHSTQPISYFLIVELIAQVLVDKNAYRGAISLAVASYLSYSPLYLLFPLLALTYMASGRGSWGREVVVQCSAIFVVSLSMLMLLSFALTALQDFVFQCYWPVMLFLKIAPNMGLWWYLFTEMFDFFTPLYKGIFNLYSFVFIVPLTIRLYEPASLPKIGDSFLAMVLCCLWVSFTKPYPVVGDLGFILSMLPIFRNTVIPRTKFLPLTMLMLIVCLLLAPIFYYCWIVLGNGNSNFFYSMNLVWAGVHVLLFLDLIWGRLVYDYVQINQVKDTESIRLTQM